MPKALGDPAAFFRQIEHVQYRDESVCVGVTSCIVSMNGDDYVEETCARYYPTTQGAAIQTRNGVNVTLLALVTTQHVTKRVLRLTSDALSQPWTVTQFQLQSWKMYDLVCASNKYKLYCISITHNG